MGSAIVCDDSLSLVSKCQLQFIGGFCHGFYETAEFDMNSIEPFEVAVADQTLASIKSRVSAFPWHEMPDDGGWDYGTNLDYMKELSDYWVSEFDWRKQEAHINRFSHFKVPIDGIDIHYIHEKGSGPVRDH